MEVYVEDTGNPAMWQRIIAHLLPAGIKLRSVNLLGGRRNVVDACALDQAEDGRRRIYIIDGDFDRFLGRRKPRLKFLYRLRSYCVENLLLSRKALLAVAAESAHRMTPKNVSDALAWDSIVLNFNSLLKPLFVAYATAFKVAPQVQTIQYSVYRLLRRIGTDSHIDRNMVGRRIREIIRDTSAHSSTSAFNSEFRAISIRVKNINAAELVSGKDYLLPFFERLLRDRFGYRGSTDQLKARLAAEFDRQIEPAFARAIAAL